MSHLYYLRSVVVEYDEVKILRREKDPRIKYIF